MEFSESARQSIRDVGTLLLGIAGGWITRRWRTPHEKTEQNTLLLAMMSKELGIKTEDLMEALRGRVEEARWRMEWETKYNILLSYLLKNIEYMRKNHLKPLKPPKELESDPLIVKIISKKSKRPAK